MFLVFTLLGFVKHLNTTDLVDVNLYKILGLQEEASPRDIKRTYKRFLVQKNRVQSPSERTLRLWQQTELAYDILSDPPSKKLYDQFGIQFLNQTGFSVFGYKSDFEIAFIKKMYKQTPASLDEFGGIVSFPVQFNLIDFLNGAQKTVSAIQTTTCVCPRGGVKCAKCRQSPWMTKLVQHQIELPPGANEFHRILVPGLGDTQSLRGAADVAFVVYCRSDPLFVRRGANLVRNMTVTLAQALSGGEIEIENFDGENLKVEVGGGIEHGSEKKIEGKGLPFFDEPKKRGDLLVKFAIEFPKELTPEQKKVVEEVLPIDLSEYE
jgi:DnaJ-class molecular chaperone